MDTTVYNLVSSVFEIFKIYYKSEICPESLDAGRSPVKAYILMKY